MYVRCRKSTDNGFEKHLTPVAAVIVNVVLFDIQVKSFYQFTGDTSKEDYYAAQDCLPYNPLELTSYANYVQVDAGARASVSNIPSKTVL